MNNKNLVSTQWLHDHLTDEKLVLLYSQMDNPVTGEKESPIDGYIANSLFFDFENVFCDKKSKWPHTMPNVTAFTEEASNLGISTDSLIVVYDNKGVYSAPRVWWMLKSMGCKNVYILNGGLPKWLAEQRTVVDELNQDKRLQEFTPIIDASLFITAEKILEGQGSLKLLDARSKGRFYGTAPEPRAGLRSGHAPSAINLPFTDLINGFQLKSDAELTLLFQPLNLHKDEHLVFSCGSGVTACILALAASQLGYTNLSVYDGSWAEWGARVELPVEL